MRRGVLALGLALAGCAARQEAAVSAPPLPEDEPVGWDVREKDAVRLELVETLVAGGEDRLALEMIGALRADGAGGPRLDQLQAEALMGLGRHAEALAILEPGRSRDPERLRLLGLAYLETQRLPEAIRSFERALKASPVGPRRAELYNNLGFALAADGRHVEAMERYHQALREDPANHRARNNLGFSLAALDQDDQALAAFLAVQEDLRQPPPLAEANAWFNLGLAREARGDLPGALLAYERALGLSPEHPRATQALAKLSTETP